MLIKVELNLTMGKFNFVIVMKESMWMTGPFVYVWRWLLVRICIKIINPVENSNFIHH